MFKMKKTIGVVFIMLLVLNAKRAMCFPEPLGTEKIKLLLKENQDFKNLINDSYVLYQVKNEYCFLEMEPGFSCYEYKLYFMDTNINRNNEDQLYELMIKRKSRGASNPKILEFKKDIYYHSHNPANSLVRKYLVQILKDPVISQEILRQTKNLKSSEYYDEHGPSNLVQMGYHAENRYNDYDNSAFFISFVSKDNLMSCSSVITVNITNFKPQWVMGPVCDGDPLD